jgi:quercetin dioxygenase-like cupin family protein
MALPHATPGHVIDVRPLGDRLPESVSIALVKTGQLELIRWVLPAGRQIPPHKLAGELTLQCLEGVVEVLTAERASTLQAGEMLYLRGGEVHSVRGIEDASVLLTLLLQPTAPNPTAC